MATFKAKGTCIEVDDTGPKKEGYLLFLLPRATIYC